MKFTQEQKDMFRKNIDAIQVKSFRDKICAIKKPNLYKVVLGKDPLDINFVDLRDNKKIYKNPIKDLEDMLKKYDVEYRYYKVLTFYGFGNGLLFKGLLQNPNLAHILVFEREIEILFLAFHFVDFSKELKENKIIISFSKEATYNSLLPLYNHKSLFYFYSRTYFMDITTVYYEKFEEEILYLNRLVSIAIKNSILMNGNDPYDALQGISQYVLNLKDKLTNSNFKDFLRLRKNTSKTAIIVSTGPSLIKQLPLLKQYRDKVVIFCADSAYPILYKYAIKPDYVSMLERTEITAEFFNHDFGNFDEDIVFLPYTVVHPNAYKYLNKYNRKYISIDRLLSFQLYMNLTKYGYIDYTISVAHLNFIVAYMLGNENIIFIGQDLAYADNGNSHPDEYQNSATYESSLYTPFDIEAYGGYKLVKTHTIWKSFKDSLETLTSSLCNKIKIYNATEGGARIEHTIEKPFKECCEELLKEDIQRPFVKIPLPSKKQEDELMLKAYFRVYLSAKHCEKEEKNMNERLSILSEKLQKYKNADNLKEFEKDMEDEINNIDKLRQFMLDDKEFFDIYELLQPLTNQLMLHLAKCYTLPVRDENERLAKMYLIFKENVLFADYFRGAVKEQKNTLLRDIKVLEEELLKRGFEKRLLKIKARSENIINKDGGGALKIMFNFLLKRLFNKKKDGLI